jgi:predicted dehydrogenase
MHLRTLDLLEAVEGIYLCPDEGEETPAELMRETTKIRGVLRGLDALVNERDASVVLVTLRNARVRATALRLIRAGKHLYCEKPLGVSAEDARAIRDEAVAQGAHVSVCYPWRFHPCIREIRRIIAEGALGRVMQLEVRMAASQVRLRDPNHWLFRRAESGGGVLSWLGCHWFDALRYILQDEVLAVAGSTRTLSGEKIDVEDAACLSLRFASGAIGSFSAGYLLPGGRPGYEGGAFDTALRIWGHRGRITWDPALRDSPVTIETVSAPEQGVSLREFNFERRECRAYSGPWGLEHAAQFFAAVEGESDFPSSVDDAIHVHRILEAAYRASESGCEADVAG